MAVPDVPGRPPSESGGATSAAAGSQERAEGRGGADTRMNRKGSVTLDLSQVDAETLRDFTVSFAALEPHDQGFHTEAALGSTCWHEPLT